MDTFNIPALQPSNRNGEIHWPEAPSMKQYFSLPESIIYYITKNPSTPEVYSKLIQSCKYFFEKLPLLIISRIHGCGERICSNDSIKCGEMKRKCCVQFDITKLRSSKIWLTNEFEHSCYCLKNNLSLFLAKFYRCENARLTLFCRISAAEFKLWTRKFQIISLQCESVIYDDGSDLTLEKIIELLPNVKELYHHFSRATTPTMKSICKLKNLANLQKFVLRNTPDTLNVKDLDEFITKHKETKIYLYFRSNISEGYKTQLDGLIDTIIASEVSNRIICYRGQDNEKFEIMTSRYTQ